MAEKRLAQGGRAALSLCSQTVAVSCEIVGRPQNNVARTATSGVHVWLPSAIEQMSRGVTILARGFLTLQSGP
jgi:hypothetical protein